MSMIVKSKTSRRYSPEMKERAVRMVLALRVETSEKHGSVKRVAEQLDVGVESVRSWVKQTEIDNGDRPGTTSADGEELRRANNILKSASALSRRRHPMLILSSSECLKESPGGVFVVENALREAGVEDPIDDLCRDVLATAVFGERDLETCVAPHLGQPWGLLFRGVDGHDPTGIVRSARLDNEHCDEQPERVTDPEGLTT